MMKKKLLSMCLVVCMVLTVLPTFAIAAQRTPTYPPAFEGYQLDPDGMEWEILRLVNIERAKEKLPPLLMTKFTQGVAQIRGADLLVDYRKDHTRPDGSLYSTVFDIVLNKPYKPIVPETTVVTGENIAWSKAPNLALIDAGTFMTGWMNSPGHKANILSPKYKFIGIGVAKDPDKGVIYAVQNFASDDSLKTAMTASWGEGAYNNTITNNLNKEHLTVPLMGTFAAAHGDALMPFDYSMVDATNPSAPKINHGVTLDEGITPDYDIGTNPPGGGGGSAGNEYQPDTLFYKNVSEIAVNAMIYDANNAGTTTAPFLLIWALKGCIMSQDAAAYAHKIANENHLPVFVYTSPSGSATLPRKLLEQAGLTIPSNPNGFVMFSFPIVLYFDGTKWAEKGQWKGSDDSYPAYKYYGQSIAEYLKKNNLLTEKKVFVTNDIEFEVDQKGELIDMRDYLKYGYEMDNYNDPDAPNKVKPKGVALNNTDGASDKIGFNLIYYVYLDTYGKLATKAFPTASNTGTLKFTCDGKLIKITSHFVKIADTAAKLNAAFSGFNTAAEPTSTHALNIRLKADITGPVAIEAGNDRSFNLDMNGFSITGGIVHKGTGKLTIKNATNKGAISAADAPAINVTGAGAVELDGVTVTSAATGSKGTITFATAPGNLTAKNSTITNTTGGYAVYLTGASSTAGFTNNSSTISGKVFPENITYTGATARTYGEQLSLAVAVATTKTAADKVALYIGETKLAEATLSNKTATLTYNTALKGIPIGEKTNLTIKAINGSTVYDTASVTASLAKNPITATIQAGATKQFNGTTRFTDIPLTITNKIGDDDVTATADCTRTSMNAGSEAATAATVKLGGTHAAWYTAPAAPVTGTVVVTKAPGTHVTNTVTLRTDATTALQYTITGLPANKGTVASYTVGGFTGNVDVTENAGVLSISLKAGAAAGQTATIPVTVVTQNYEDIVVTITVKLIDKTDVSSKITFADASKPYKGSAIIHEAATIAAGYTGAITYTYAVKAGGSLDANQKPLTVGTYTVTATYEDADNQGVKTAVLTITKAASEVVPTPDKTTYTYGETIALAATVGAARSRAASANQVEFFAGTTSLGTANVSNGTATLNYNTTDGALNVGNNTIKAVYGGSVNLNGSESNTITIKLQPKALTGASIAGATKVYDGNANFKNVAVTLTGAIEGDTVTATAAFAVANKNAGEAKAISSSVITLAGADSKYYTAPEALTGTATITRKPLASLTVTVADKVYNGNTATLITGITSPDLVAGDTLRIGTDVTVVALFESANAAESANVNSTISEFTHINYSTTVTSATSTAKISPATATAPSIGEQTIKRGKTLDNLQTQIGTVTAGGVNGEVLSGTVTLTAPSFEALALGTHTIPFTFTKDSTDTKWANYSGTPVSGTVTVEITALDPQTISFTDGESAKSVTYGDAGFTSICTNQTAGGGSITYESSNEAVATVNATTGAVTIKGAGSANIIATAAEVPTQFAKTIAQYALTVNKKTITITGVAVQTKDYDATTNATLGGGTLNGVLEGDKADVGFTLPAGATFDTANAGAAKAVTIGAVTLTGTQSGNYTLTQPTGVKGEIRKANPTLTLGNLNQMQNGVTAVTATIAPASADATALVEYSVLRTAAVPAKPATPAVACNHTAGTSPCTAAVGGTCAHDDGCAYKAEIPATPEIPAVYEWTVTVPQLEGKYDVRATLPAGTAGANLNAVTEPVLGKLTISVYIPPSDDGGFMPPAPKPDAPVTDPATGNTEVSVPVKPVNKGNTSSATVPEKSVSDAIVAAEKEAAKTGGTASVAITVNAPKDAKTVETTLSGKSLTAVAEGKTKGLKIATPVADVHFDSEALKNIAGMAGKDVKISATKVETKALTDTQKVQVGDAPVFDFTVTSGGKSISSFNGGTATVSVPYTPKENEKSEFLTVWLLDDAGKLIPIKASYKDGKITFETEHFSRYAIGYLPFTDVTPDWSYESIVYAYQNKLFFGCGDDKFAPEDNMSRAMLWTALYRMAGSPDKTDATLWYADAQKWAMSNGISDGTSPDGNITREQLATVLFRYKKVAATAVDMSSFIDASQISTFAKDGMGWAVESKILKGTNGKLNPQDNTTRAEVAAILQRLAALHK